MNTLTKLIEREPVFKIPTILTDSEIQLDRLIEIVRNQITSETSPICLWIIDFWSCIERFERIFDQYINLISKYEARLESSIKTSSELSIQK